MPRTTVLCAVCGTELECNVLENGGDPIPTIDHRRTGWLSHGWGYYFCPKHVDEVSKLKGHVISWDQGKERAIEQAVELYRKENPQPSVENQPTWKHRWNKERDKIFS